MKIANFFTIIIAMGLMACGKPNPATDYSDLRARGVTSDEAGNKQKPQSYVDCRVVGFDHDKVLNFKETVEGKFEVKASVKLAGVEIDLSARNFPNGTVDIKKQSTDNNTWDVSWTPSKDTVKNEDKTFFVNFDIEILDNDSRPSVDTINKINKTCPGAFTTEIPIIVSNKYFTPEISIVGVPESISLSEKPTTFYVDVKDPDFNPQLQTDVDATDKPSGASGLNAENLIDIVSVTPEKQNGDVWRYTFVIDTSNERLSLIQPHINKNADPILYTFEIKAFNPSSGKSASKKSQSFHLVPPKTNESTGA